MSRLSDERGAAAIVVLLTMTVLFAMGALVVDVAALYQERRTLQNGADAAALSIAEECGAGDCGDPDATADEYADANADDDATTVEEICGSAVDGADACIDAPTLPDGADYVRVTTMTETDDGSDLLPYTFARVFDLVGGTVRARATVAWGGPASFLSELPMTISQCEFDAYTDEGGELAPPPPYTTGYPSQEAVIYLHDTTGANPCPAGPSGSDLPGGFGWLDTTTDCTATSDIEGWWDDSTGRPPPSSCDVEEMAALVGTVIHLPIFIETNGLNGTNGEYRMAGFASFYVTGYSIVGQYKVESLASGHYPCGGSSSCVSGYFVNDLQPYEGMIGGPSMGVTVVSFVQ